MNWFGNLPAGTEGFEYHLLAIGLGAIVAVKGSGALSIDRLVATHLAGGRAALATSARPLPAAASERAAA
jgi:hypothetical protein